MSAKCIPYIETNFHRYWEKITNLTDIIQFNSIHFNKKKFHNSADIFKCLPFCHSCTVVLHYSIVD